MNRYTHKYRTQSTRLQHWDYGNNAAYFVTICCKNRVCFFGDVVENECDLSAIGNLAKQFWLEVPDHFSFVELGSFVIMPNHAHGIIVIDKPVDTAQSTLNSTPVETRHCLVSTTTDSPGQQRFQNQGRTLCHLSLVLINLW